MDSSSTPQPMMLNLDDEGPRVGAIVWAFTAFLVFAALLSLAVWVMFHA